MRTLRWWLGIAGTGIVLALLVRWSERPPHVVPASAPATEFSAARAWPILAVLADTIGYRVTGTQGADRALVYLEEQARAIPRAEVQVQDVTGARTYGPDFVRAYRTKNLLVRIPGKAREAVLVSSHYDSPTASVGASDAGVSVAAMLEMIRAIAAAPTLPYTVIFNINGAEEQGLLGAHGFLMHPWMQDVKSFIDLESAGTANKAILFQTGPGNPWLANAYARSAPHPYGTVLGQDIFQSGAIPSATDFEIYRDGAHVPGVDIAFFRNGYAYHTQLDQTWNVAPGSLQHIGANALALTRELASHASPARSEQRAVYYDILGQTMLTYEDRTANALALAAALLAIGALALAMRRLVITPKDLLIGGLIPLTGWVLGVALSVAMSLVPVILAGRSHSWFAHPVLPFTAYAAFALAPMLALHGWWARRRASGIAPAWAGALVFFTLLLLLLTASGVGSAYLLLWWVAPAAVGLVVLALSGGHRPALAAIGFVPGALFTMQAAVLLTEFRSIGGRMLLSVPYDVVMAAILATVALLLLTLPLTLVHDGGRPGRAALAFALGGLIALAAGIVRFPYTHLRPQRIAVAHRELPTGSHLRISGFDYPGPARAAKGIGAARMEAGGSPRRGPFLVEAPPVGYPAPEVTLLTATADSASGQRTLTLHLAPTEAYLQQISLPGARFVRWSMSDSSVHATGPQDSEATAHFVSAPDSGWTIGLTVRGTEPVELRLTSVYARTTEPAAALMARLPDWTSSYATAQVRKTASF